MITNELYDNPYNHEIRNYEVSLWTLQDEFITVLKWSDVEHKGTILDPKFTLSDDATELFKFTIPMYFYERGELRENPIWYTTRNGNLMVNLRKIKVIFNKLKDTELVFEFLITKVTEEHEQDHMFCNVECEGLAFHELGKIGYTEVLSAADFELDYKNWQEKGYWTKCDGTKVYSEPIQNVQYWCNARLGLEHIPLNEGADIDPRKWYYDIVMQWDSFEEGGTARRDSGKVYEESFVTKWDYDPLTNKLVPNGIEKYREKERAIEASESNLYNITQTIAETFGIFCKYIYSHDSNYHISERKILFFNNYLHDLNIMSLTYPYSSLKVTREMDSTDVVTKLYVKSVDNQSTLLGEDSIRYCEANLMMEDYIFNFDYLKETNSITDELYTAIDEYIRLIHNLNNEIIPLQNKISVYYNQETELKAKITTYKNSAALAQEQIDNNLDYITSLLADHSTDGRYIDSFDSSHPDTGIIIEDEKGLYYINLNSKKKGIRPDSVKIYRNYPIRQGDLDITGFSFVNDEYGNPTRIYGIAPTNDSSKVYLIYLYEPRLYYDAIIAYFEEKLARDNDKKIKAEIELGPESIDDIDFDFKGVYSTYAAELSLTHREYSLATTAEKDAVKTAAYNGGLNKKIKDTKEEIERNILEKEKVIAEFNYMMGPALREGNWTPENYLDYGERHEATKEFPLIFDESLISLTTGNDFALIWDNKLFDEEQDIYYEVGINQEKKFYPCINLSRIPANHYFWLHMEDYSFIFNSAYYQSDVNKDTTDIKYIKSFKIGSEAILGFVTSTDLSTTNDDNIIYPVLILIGAKTMTDTATNFEDQLRMIGGTIGFMMDPERGNPRLTIIKTEVEEKNVTVTVDTDSTHLISLGSTYWTFGDNNFGVDVCLAVYPRIKFSSLMLKYLDDKFFIHLNGTLLTNYNDYLILNRNLGEGTYAPEFYITIKPYTFLNHLNLQSDEFVLLDNSTRVAYTLSNAGTAIYLDAIEIEKENAYPKVSYTVDPNVLNKDIISTLYNRLNWLVMINDSLLKLVNTFGYISKLELDLDFPDKDSIEVKNYKSKFEDLFSSIVASTEAIKSNENMLASLSAGTYNVSGDSLSKTLENNSAVVQKYLDDYFKNSEVVQGTLKDLFLGASEVLVDSSLTLNLILTLNAENSSILSSFAEKIRTEYNPTIYRLAATPMTFKRGDTWIEIDGNGVELATYTALCDSSMSSGGFGWNKVHYGSVALIIGELNIDAKSGKVDLLGKDMSITGSHSVNITGPYVNIESFTFDNGDSQIDAGVFITAKRVGINETELTTQTILSEIEVRPDLLSIFGGEISLLTGNSKNQSVSAINLNKDGIYIGSNAGIRLYSGTIYDPQTLLLNGTSIELLLNHLLIGASAGNNATAVKITPQMFIATSGTSTVTGVDMTANIENSGLTGVKASGNIVNSLTGVKIANGFFGVVTNNSGNINAMIMNSSGFTLAYNLTGIANAGDPNLTTTTGLTGSYVRLSGLGITISSGAKLNISASDLMIGTLNLNEYGNATFKMSNDAIWAGVTNYANGTNTYLKLADDEVYITAAKGLTSSYAQIKAGLIDLHAGNTEYIKMSNDGLQLWGRSITINGEPIWSNQRILYSTTRPSNPTAPGLAGKPWIWIAPKLNSQWVYTHAGEVLSNGNGSVNGAQTTTLLSSSAEPITDGNTWYKYELTFNIRRSSTNGTETRHIKAFLRATVDGAQREVAFDLTNEVTISGANQSFKLTKEYNGNNISAYNVAAGNSINLLIGYWYNNNSWLTLNVLFYISSIILTISTNSASSGAYPCIVYYMVP